MNLNRQLPGSRRVTVSQCGWLTLQFLIEPEKLSEWQELPFRPNLSNNPRGGAEFFYPVVRGKDDCYSKYTWGKCNAHLEMYTFNLT
jgi:hypothetical protein